RREKVAVHLDIETRRRCARGQVLRPAEVEVDEFGWPDPEVRRDAEANGESSGRAPFVNEDAPGRVRSEPDRPSGRHPAWGGVRRCGRLRRRRPQAAPGPAKL